MSPVIIIHYHLRAGGVSSVIQSQIEALKQANRECLILCSEEPEVVCDTPYVILPNLKYLTGSTTRYRDSFNLYKDCLTQAYLHFGEQDPIWLIHNPTLGKSALMSIFVSFLARDRRALLLQCHDLAEDGRPKNYQNIPDPQKLYPLAENIHYAFINPRDLARFRNAGLEAHQSHLLESCVSPTKIHRTPLSAPLILYPVRGIRRKNLGELLLWSLLAPPNTTFALTLEPTEKQWRPYYTLWETLAQEMRLPVVFGCVEACPDASFTDWLASATHCLTTSIAEGFGLTFIESHFHKIPLIGRDLPEITSQFKSTSKTSSSLYTSLLIPQEWINREDLKESLSIGLDSTRIPYGLPPLNGSLEKHIESLIFDGHCDFGNLPEYMQVKILYKLQDPSHQQRVLIKNLNGHTLPAKQWFADELQQTSHTSVDLSYYTPESYLERFTNLLECVENSSRHSPYWLSPDSVLKQYSAPRDFHFLQSFE